MYIQDKERRETHYEYLIWSANSSRQSNSNRCLCGYRNNKC